MARFNTPASTQTKTTNLAGGEAFTQSPKLEFVSILLTSFVQDQYYRTAKDGIAKLRQLISQIPDKRFVAKAAIYGRTKYGMRSVSHVVAAELAQHVSGQTWAKDFYEKVVYRPDDMIETLAYFFSVNGKSVPHAIKKGFAKAFDRFDGYQLAKYQAKTKSVSLVDVVNLVHPKPTEKNAEALKLLIEDKLVSSGTWETDLTKAGQKAETDEEKEQLKSGVWEKLISERKIGYFALLRNLRNISQQAPQVLDAALEMLRDEKLISKSLVMPFRFLSAYRMLEVESTSGNILAAISDALEISVANVPDLPNTLVVADTSGSMWATISDKSITKRSDIALLPGAILAKKSQADFMIFASKARYKNFNPNSLVMDIVNSYQSGEVGHGTDFHSIFTMAKKAYDRIIIFSDMQGWIGYHPPTSSVQRYRQTFNCNPHIYSIDLAGYGSMQFPEKQVYCLSGFSDKIFDVMALLESDKKALINEIEAVQI